MKSIYIPLGIISDTSVLLFEAESKPAQEAGQYRLSYSVCVKTFDPENPRYATNKHRVFEDYLKAYREKFPRRSAKNEAKVDELLESNLSVHVAEACYKYSVPVTDKRFDSFSYADFEQYKEDLFGLDLETERVYAGMVEAMCFCQDYLTNDSPDVNEHELLTTIDTSLKFATVVKHFCNQLHTDGKMETLLDAGVDLQRIGNCLYYGIQGHGTGFFDEQGIKNDKDFLDYLDKVMQRYYIDVALNGKDIVADVSIDKNLLKPTVAEPA